MLDTCICSFVMRKQPEFLLEKFQSISRHHQLVISAITYAEMQYGIIGKNASPKHAQLVTEFVSRVDAILPWDVAAVDASTKVKLSLALKGTPIGGNDTAIAGHALSQSAVLVTNNVREFSRVEGLVFEDWSNP
ncbi:MAG TPA: VapC toxin family PIN domain ribonuclease [Oceanospirillaceae bacterium]|nr:VapC toxin family PIN domain ribonuclease [Oceanospirillaceae bacterium]